MTAFSAVLRPLKRAMPLASPGEAYSLAEVLEVFGGPTMSLRVKDDLAGGDPLDLAKTGKVYGRSAPTDALCAVTPRAGTGPFRLPLP